MPKFDYPNEPLIDAVRRARKEGRKRVTIAGYRVTIHPNHALFSPLKGKNKG